MARNKKAENAELKGAEEFLGADPEKEAIEKIAAAKAAAAKEAEQDTAKTKGDNGGPILDEHAWRRAANELVAEQMEIDALMEKVAEVRGRISSIKKVAEKCGADWDVIKLYAKYDKRVRQGEAGAVVTEQRRLSALMRLMESPLHTQFGLFPDEPVVDPSSLAAAKPGFDAELQGQHAYRNSEPEDNNPFPPGSDQHVDWQRGWRNAQAATARSMGDAAGTA
jgi:hypothetical protein